MPYLICPTLTAVQDLYVVHGLFILSIYIMCDVIFYYLNGALKNASKSQ